MQRIISEQMKVRLLDQNIHKRTKKLNGLKSVVCFGRHIYFEAEQSILLFKTYLSQQLYQ